MWQVPSLQGPLARLISLGNKMGLHPNFPVSPYAPLIPERRSDFVFVDQVGFKKHAVKNFAALAASFTEYK